MDTPWQPVIYKSQPTPVNMTDVYFDFATIDHFWVQRRFRVFQKLAGSYVRKGGRLLESGCGNGVVQRLVEDEYGLEVTGVDLNDLALQKNICRRSPIYYYDIHQRDPEWKEHFDLVLMFDVLEHIAEPARFLESTQFHLRGAKTIVVNVPAFQFLYSAYDRVNGHFLRYTIESLRKVAQQSGMKVLAYTYWGAPLVPMLVARKALLKFRHSSEQQIIASGFDPGSPLLNRAFGTLSLCEPIPQKVVGTSLMAVLEAAV